MEGKEVFNDDVIALRQISFAPHPVHKVPTLFFEITRADSAQVVGEINLRLGSTDHIDLYAGHVGYNIHLTRRGNHYAARAVRLLIPLARKHGINPLWLTCDQDDHASRRFCEHAGARFVETIDVPATCIIHRSGHPKKCRYRMDL